MVLEQICANTFTLFPKVSIHNYNLRIMVEMQSLQLILLHSECLSESYAF